MTAVDRPTEAVAPVAVVTRVPAPSRAATRARLVVVGTRVASGVLAVGLWQCGAVMSAGALPGPAATLGGVRRAVEDSTLLPDLAVTTARMIAAFVPALAVAVLAGLLLGTSRIASDLVSPWVAVGAAVPALVVTVVTYLALGVTEVAAVVAAFLGVVPSMTRQIADGVRAGDPRLREMARAFGASPAHVLWRVRLPELVPWIVTTARLGWSLTWRLVLLVELVGRSTGVGYRIESWFTLADMPAVLGVALPFVTLMLGAEALVLRPVERRVRRRYAVEAR